MRTYSISRWTQRANLAKAGPCMSLPSVAGSSAALQSRAAIIPASIAFTGEVSASISCSLPCWASFPADTAAYLPLNRELLGVCEVVLNGRHAHRHILIVLYDIVSQSHAVEILLPGCGVAMDEGGGGFLSGS